MPGLPSEDEIDPCERDVQDSQRAILQRTPGDAFDEAFHGTDPNPDPFYWPDLHSPESQHVGRFTQFTERALADRSEDLDTE